MEKRRVVITGMGAITPIGNSVKEFWQGILSGKSGADLITKFDASQHTTKFACEVKNFNIEDYFDRKEARKYDLFTIFALGPCEVLIPNLMYPAAEKNYMGVAMVAGVFSVATIATMIAIVLLLSFGIKNLRLGFLEKYMHVLAGATIFLSGCAIVFLDW